MGSGDSPAAARARYVEGALRDALADLTKGEPDSAWVPGLQVVIGGPTAHWGVRRADNQRVTVLLPKG